MYDSYNGNSNKNTSSWTPNKNYGNKYTYNGQQLTNAAISTKPGYS